MRLYRGSGPVLWIEIESSSFLYHYTHSFEGGCAPTSLVCTLHCSLSPTPLRVEVLSVGYLINRSREVLFARSLPLGSV